MSRHAIVGVVVLAAVASSFAVPPAGGSALQSTAERPPGTVTHVEIEFQPGGERTEGSVEWLTFYTARSEEEAARAENGSLSVDWFRGPDYVPSAITNHTGSRVTSGNTAVDYVRSDEETDLGRIYVTYGATWEGVFAGNRSRVVVGPAFAAGLSDGDRFIVNVPKSWEAESANANRYSAGSEIFDHYGWTIGEDPTPRVVFNESGVSPDWPWSDGVPGPGPALALLALLVAAGLRWLHADV